MHDRVTNKIDNAIALYLAGDLRRAEKIYKKILKHDAVNHNVLRLLGMLENKKGKKHAAKKLIKQAIRINPEIPAYYNNLGEIYRSEQEYDNAILNYQKAISLNAQYAQAYNNLGCALQQSNRIQDAIDNFNAAITNDKGYAEAYGNRGAALQELGQIKAAIGSYDKAIQLSPDYAEAHNGRGTALKELGQLKEAVTSINRAIQIQPDFAAAHNNHGVALKHLGHPQEAIESYGRAIQLVPDYAEAYRNRGTALNELGQQKEAKESYEKAVQLKPDFSAAYRDLSHLKEYTAGDPQITSMERLHVDAQHNEPDRMQLSFALAKAYEDLGEYDRSFNYLQEGNRLRKNELSYNFDVDKKLIAKIKSIFTTGSLALSCAPGENKPTQPLFIVGMPRSGTSLVEQILASHTEVHGAGELRIMSDLVNPILLNMPDQNIRDDTTQSLKNKIKAVRDDYLKALTALKVSEKIITDKMPINFLWLGFIISSFPKAKIIHLNRDPRATCWSIYKHYFVTSGNGYAYDLADLANFYNTYIELMAFWRERFPGNIHDLCYDDLTENQEEETHKLLSFCDLKWEAQCLDFHKTKRQVRTASSAQVRKKMYTGSSEAWRKYEKHLQPLVSGLKY